MKIIKKRKSKNYRNDSVAIDYHQEKLCREKKTKLNRNHHV